MRPVKSLVIAGLVFLSQAPRPASALPVFAHRYGLTCQACHTTVPHLNSFGRAFQERGYWIPGAVPRAVTPPVAVKVNLAYSSDADSTGLPKAIVDEVELLTGGAIGRRFNYFLEQYAVDGGVPGRPRDMWLQFNGGSSHIRAGEFTLPLPVDPETERDTEAHYLVYDQTVGDNPFNFFDARTGIEAYTQTQSGFEAHLASFRRGALVYASKTFGGHFKLDAYRYQGTAPVARAADDFYRQGFGAGANWGKFESLLVLQHGNDSNPGTGAPAASSGGFLQAHYTFSPSLMAVARADRTYDAISGTQRQTILSLVMRPARNMRFTVEDQITDHHTLNMGWLFAY